MKLYPHQEKAVERLKNGSVLVGGVGSGKSLTALYYWDTKICKDKRVPLYIITTARKRDTHDWEQELEPFVRLGKDLFLEDDVTVDSWNNIGKYLEVKNAFFIFDEQRIVSYGSWSKAFVRITGYYFRQLQETRGMTIYRCSLPMDLLKTRASFIGIIVSLADSPNTRELTDIWTNTSSADGVVRQSQS